MNTRQRAARQGLPSDAGLSLRQRGQEAVTRIRDGTLKSVSRGDTVWPWRPRDRAGGISIQTSGWFWRSCATCVSRCELIAGMPVDRENIESPHANPRADRPQARRSGSLAARAGRRPRRLIRGGIDSRSHRFASGGGQTPALRFRGGGLELVDVLGPVARQQFKTLTSCHLLAGGALEAGAVEV